MHVHFEFHQHNGTCRIRQLGRIFEAHGRVTHSRGLCERTRLEYQALRVGGKGQGQCRWHGRGAEFPTPMAGREPFNIRAHCERHREDAQVAQHLRLHLPCVTCDRQIECRYLEAGTWYLVPRGEGGAPQCGPAVRRG